MTDMVYTYLESPVGALLLVGHNRGLVRIGFPEGKGKFEPDPNWECSREPFGESIGQLEAYFEGRLRIFDIPLLPEGTPFQRGSLPSRDWQQG